MAAQLHSANADSPQGYLYCSGHGSSGAAEHTITIYSKGATVDGTRYDMSQDDQQYVLMTKNYMVDAIPGAAGMLLVEINRVTGKYEISAGTDNPIQHETGICSRARRKL
jgi:hypothetical protein